jgi:surfeit locus 1 family protein
VAQCGAQAHENRDEQANDEQPEQGFHLAVQCIGCRALSNSRRRRFAPSWWLTVGAVLLCAVFIRLGFWQWDRGNVRQAQWTEFSRGADEAVALDARGVDAVARFQRVTVIGQLDAEHQFLLDNRSHAGRPGYEVLTPLDRPGGQIVLIDRGWVPFTGSRNKLPDVAPLSHGTAMVKVTGRADDLPSGGLALGRAAPTLDAGWPKVTSYPTMKELSAALARPLEPRIVLLDAGEPNGYVRDWRPPGMEPIRHWSYAIQWWAFAIVTLIFWAVVSRTKA